MSLIKWRRPQTTPAVFDEMDRMLDRYFRRPLVRAFEGEEFDFGPPVDMYETETEVVVKAELPGVSKENIDLTVEDDRFVIRGETKHEEEVHEEGYYRREIRSGSFRRSVPLPAAIKAEEVQANFSDGLLTIRAPKQEDVETGRKVDIE